MNLLIVAIIVNSALYIGMVFTAGLVTHNETAYILAIVTAGLCYVAPLVQVSWPGHRAIETVLVLISIASGLVACLALLIGG